MIENKELVSILVVDDEKFQLDLLIRHLKREGYTNTETAENGHRALEVLQSKVFDIVLLDIDMPELDGIAVLERLKRDDKLCSIPVVMVTGHEDYETITKCIELGAEDYLPKPVHPAILRNRITATMVKKRLAKENG